MRDLRTLAENAMANVVRDRANSRAIFLILQADQI